MQNPAGRRVRWNAPSLPSAPTHSLQSAPPTSRIAPAIDSEPLDGTGRRKSVRRRASEPRDRGPARGQSPYESSYDITHGYCQDRSITLP